MSFRIFFLITDFLSFCSIVDTSSTWILAKPTGEVKRAPERQSGRGKLIDEKEMKKYIFGIFTFSAG